MHGAVVFDVIVVGCGADLVVVVVVLYTFETVINCHSKFVLYIACIADD